MSCKPCDVVIAIMQGILFGLFVLLDRHCHCSILLHLLPGIIMSSQFSMLSILLWFSLPPFSILLPTTTEALYVCFHFNKYIRKYLRIQNGAHLEFLE